MKILRISLRNIASLAGLHTVDFTCEPLQAAGLFAISGATGAGKSSLLDALCLALYDSTPRLNRVGRLDEMSSGEKQNDPRTLLRRGAAEGLAEVAFVGVDGRDWTARWYVRRARNRPDGNLQQTEMTLFRGHIAAAGEGTIEAGGKKTEVLAAILSRIGLTFEQFTRAVLLAQNDFATFLKADDRERAEILQALTGTEQFEAISRAVFERASREKKGLEQLKDRLKGQQPLSAEDRVTAEADLRAALLVQQDLDRQVGTATKHIDWFREHQCRRDRLQLAQQAHAAAVKQLSDAAARRDELQQTEQVHREARVLRDTQLAADAWLQQAQKAVSDAGAAVTQHQTQQQQTADQLKNAESRRDQLRSRQTEIRPQLDEARRLDALLPAASERLQQTTAGRDHATDQHKSADNSLSAAQKRQQQLTSDVSSVQTMLNRLSVVMPFSEETSLWLDRMDTAVRTSNDVQLRQQEHETAVRVLQTAEQQLNDHQQQTAELQRALEESENSLNAALADEANFDVEQLTASYNRCLDSLRVLTGLQHHLKDVVRLRDEHQKNSAEVDRLEQDIQRDQLLLLDVRQQQLGRAEAAVDAARNSLQLIEAAVDDAAGRLRETLQEELPCPVCGSVQHPYRQHAPELEVTAIQAARKALRQQEKQLRQITEQAVGLEAKISTRSAQVAEVRTQRDTLQQQLQDLVFEQMHHPAVADVWALPADRQADAAARKIQDISAEQKSLEQQQKAARQAAQQAIKWRQQQQAAQQAVAQHDRRMAELKNAADVASSSLRNCQRNLAESQRQHDNALQPLQHLWAVMPDGENQFRADASRFRDEFRLQTEECQSLQRQLQDHHAELDSLQSRLDLLQQTADRAAETLAACQQEFQRADDHHAALFRQRSQVLEGREADVVEAELAAQLTSVTQDWERLSQEHVDVTTKLSVANNNLQLAENHSAAMRVRSEEAGSQFQQWKQSFELSQGRSFSQQELETMLARDHQWIQQERQALDDLSHHVRTCDGAVTAHQEQLQQHESTRPTIEPEEAVSARLSALQQQLQLAQDRTNKSRALLHSDDVLLKNCQTLVQEIERVAQLADPWLKLNELIGSADGARFRMIAQRRTLDVLLEYANAHLEQLAARYRLQRLKDSLNLIVVDRDMADERRSIHSLSGGESFLVSLALALGLASLASNRLRIESLFIDEGFGSLDPETLNTAMNALMHLESQGRKVGVISHVTEMTDAIPVQIRIVKGRNGASRIVMP